MLDKHENFFMIKLLFWYMKEKHRSLSQAKQTLFQIPFHVLYCQQPKDKSKEIKKKSSPGANPA